MAWLIIGVSYWWYGKRGSTPFGNDTPQWRIILAWCALIGMGILSILFTIWAFMPGNL